MIFWLSAATLLYEIAVSRVFAYVLPYHFTPLAMSMAMLGLGLGACWNARRGERAGPGLRAHALALLAVSLLLFDAMLFLRWTLGALVLASLPPFLFLGMLISEVYGAARAPHRTYCLDLLGGSAACAAALWILVRLGPVGLTLSLACLAGAGALAAADSRRPRLRRACALAAAVSAAAFCAWCFGGIPDPGRVPRGGAQKPMHQALLREKGRIADSAWGTAGRVDLYEHPAFENIKWVYNDATNSSMLVREPDTPARREFLQRLVLNLPLAVRRPRRALIIGSGGGIEVRLARLAGVAETDAVEINGAIVALVRRWSRFAGDVYDAPGVRLHVGEGRRFLSSAPGRYDLIQMSLAFTATALSGSFALAEGNLYTLEAYRLYLDRLAPDGLLAVFDDSDHRSLRALLTALAVLEERGAASPEAMRRVAVVGNPGSDGTGYAYLVIVSPTELSAAARERLMGLCRQGRFNPLWVPGYAAQEPFASLAREGRERFIAGSAQDLRPRTDDHPYFFYFGKGWADHWTALKPLVFLSGLSLLLALGLAGASARRAPAGMGGAAAPALLCGMSFMLVEAGLLQRLALVTDSPAQVLSLLLFSLLFWCGLGSRLAEAASRRWRAGLWMPFAAAALVLGAWVFLMRGRSPWDGVARDALRPALVFLLLAPVGLSLGAPFPSLLSLHAGRPPEFKVLLWGINGFAAVAGACLAIMISFIYGIEAALFAGAGGYLTGALLLFPFAAGRRGGQ